ncbi:MAG: hypothetical protein NC217_07695 [Muribaculaceae bacterium]|nr:hypothetical protein [Muribaculaceae bacterium]
MMMNGVDKQQERERYIRAWNNTMVSIWKDRVIKLNVLDTGALYNSIVAISMNADDKFTEITLSQAFNQYGLYVDFGTGSNTYKGNDGKLEGGNPRRRKKWFSTGYYASVMNLKEFMADNMGADMANTVSNALTKDIATRYL